MTSTESCYSLFLFLFYFFLFFVDGLRRSPHAAVQRPLAAERRRPRLERTPRAAVKRRANRNVTYIVCLHIACLQTDAHLLSAQRQSKCRSHKHSYRVWHCAPSTRARARTRPKICHHRWVHIQQTNKLSTVNTINSLSFGKFWRQRCWG